MKTTLLFIAALCLSAQAQQSTPEQQRSMAELQRRIQAGEVGVNPRVQTRARSGDPNAAAQLRAQQENNAITARVNNGSITADQAALERQRAEMAYQQELARIEQQRQLEELRRQTEELRRMRQQMEMQRQYRR